MQQGIIFNHPEFRPNESSEELCRLQGELFQKQNKSVNLAGTAGVD